MLKINAAEWLRRKNGVRPLQFIEKLAADGLLRGNVTTVLLFDHSVPADMRRWGQVRPTVSNFTTVPASNGDPRTFTVAIVRQLWGLWGDERPKQPDGTCEKVRPHRKRPSSPSPHPLAAARAD